MLDHEWGALGAAVAGEGGSPLGLSPEDFADGLDMALQAGAWDAEALNDLGNRLFRIRAFSHASSCYAMVARDTHALGASVNLGRCEIRLGRVDAAESRARDLVAQHPDLFLGWQLLYESLEARQQLVDAKDAAGRAVELSGGDPTLAREWARLAALCKDPEAAARGFRLAWERRPDDFGSLGQLVFYLRCLCQWQDLDVLSARLLKALDEESAVLPPFDLLAEPATAAQQALCARRQASYIKQQVERQPIERIAFSDSAAPRLRVGFVSHGVGRHPTSILTAALFEQWRDSRLEVHVFSTRDDDGSELRKRLITAVHTFHELSGLSQRDMAAHIQAAGIEILVDLDGYSRVRVPEVFAYRPAPVQINWLAYPGTSGADYMDYVIADRFVLPPFLAPHFTEKVVYLPRCYQSSDPTRDVDLAASREAYGLPENGVVYACFNTSFKLNPRSVARMLRVLASVPGSVLWLLDPGSGGAQRLREQARQQGVASSRLVFMQKLPHRPYLACYRHVDLFLDTEDYNAHTVASDALWAGCPVLTRPGDTFASRVAGSLNHHLGMPEMNVEDDAAFIMKAVRYGRDAAYRAGIKAKLARLRSMSSLFDIQGFARDFEDVLLQMAAHRRAGKSATTFENG
jgi:predicted O-linked N-acetylglucosamine transferase (SPINDLY family)